MLPFVNMTGNTENEYIGDGIADQVRDVLTQLGSLKVPSQTSSAWFKKREDQNILKTIGEQLRVRTVFEGSVRKAGNKVRITAQLINIADGYHLWSHSYDREFKDPLEKEILDIQSDVAQQVVSALQIKLGVAAAERLARKPTENAEAYDLYLQARYSWSRRTTESIKKAIQPTYTLAHAGLADCYVVLSHYSSLPKHETFPKARAAALKSLELDSGLAEPHATLARIKELFDWDWSGAEAEYRKDCAIPVLHILFLWPSVHYARSRNSTFLSRLTWSQHPPGNPD